MHGGAAIGARANAVHGATVKHRLGRARQRLAVRRFVPARGKAGGDPMFVFQCLLHLFYASGIGVSAHVVHKPVRVGKRFSTA